MMAWYYGMLIGIAFALVLFWATLMFIENSD